jgi:lycopene cyclase domain-containing protein
MTYFGFLLQFLLFPILILAIFSLIDWRRGKRMPIALNAFPIWQVLLGICLVAFVYTTPWDNYLVATGVWGYDPNLVTGIVFGYVPIEEYTFFILQPVMTGLFFTLLARYLPISSEKANNPQLRLTASIFGLIAWLISMFVFVMSFFDANFAPFIYISITLSWALIPILLQLAFGADILARHWLLVFLAILIPTIYLSWADSLAINSGTWTINPAQSLNLFLGTLPIEEAFFFLITNTLVVTGMSLVLAEESQSRALALERFTMLRPLIQRLRPMRSNS